MTQPGIEPRSPEPLANILTIKYQKSVFVISISILQSLLSVKHLHQMQTVKDRKLKSDLLMVLLLLLLFVCCASLYISPFYYCSRRYFGLALNSIRRIISPNQDDLSYSSRISFPGSRNWVSCQTQSLWLNNAVQCRRPIGRSLIAAAAWTHEGTYLIYGFLASISDEGISVEYELDTFNTPPQEQLYITPKIGYVDAIPNPDLGA